MDMSVGQALDFEHIHTSVAFAELTAALEKIRMTNAILLYSGNVCSTPVVDYATHLPSVCVPVLEDFERHRFVNFAPSDAVYCETLAEVFDCVFARRDHPYLADVARDTDGARGRLLSEEQAAHVFFKWRGPPRGFGGRAHLARVLRAHKVKPVTILRRSVIAHATKMVLSQQHYGNTHMQFQVSREKMSDEAFQAYVADQAQVRVQFGKKDIQAVRRKAYSILRRRWEISRTVRNIFGQKRLEAVIAEDLFGRSVRIGPYEEAMSRFLEAGQRLPDGVVSQFRKGGPDVENCENYDDVCRDPALWTLERLYQRHIAGLHVISKKTDPA
ncbi:hypothetical protein shim_14160 [Shimia sp. SK013]|nr:hypothetical protein shim_14160 [Shimia sp. SK013]